MHSILFFSLAKHSLGNINFLSTIGYPACRKFTTLSLYYNYINFKIFNTFIVSKHHQYQPTSVSTTFISPSTHYIMNKCICLIYVSYMFTDILLWQVCFFTFFAVFFPILLSSSSSDYFSFSQLILFIKNIIIYDYCNHYSTW